MDSMKSRLDALSERISGIEKGRADELEQAKETFKTAESAPDFLAAFKTLFKAACGGNKEAASFLNDNSHRMPEAWRRDWNYMTEADKDEVRLRRAYADDYGDGGEAPRGFMQMTDRQRIDTIIKFWEEQQAAERKAAREAKKAAKEREKAARGRSQARTKGGGGR